MLHRCWQGGGCDTPAIRCPCGAHPRGSLPTPDLGCAEPRSGWRARVPVPRRGEASADPARVPRREQRPGTGCRVVVAHTGREHRHPDRRCIRRCRRRCRCPRPPGWPGGVSACHRRGAGRWGGSAGAHAHRRRARVLPDDTRQRATIVAGSHRKGSISEATAATSSLRPPGESSTATFAATRSRTSPRTRSARWMQPVCGTSSTRAPSPLHAPAATRWMWILSGWRRGSPGGVRVSGTGACSGPPAASPRTASRPPTRSMRSVLRHSRQVWAIARSPRPCAPPTEPPSPRPRPRQAARPRARVDGSDDRRAHRPQPSGGPGCEA